MSDVVIVAIGGILGTLASGYISYYIMLKQGKINEIKEAKEAKLKKIEEMIRLITIIYKNIALFNAKDKEIASSSLKNIMDTEISIMPLIVMEFGENRVLMDNFNAFIKYIPTQFIETIQTKSNLRNITGIYEKLLDQLRLEKNKYIIDIDKKQDRWFNWCKISFERKREKK